jgi:hypothetical protein
MNFRWPKGVCPIPVEARKRGAANPTNRHKFTKKERREGARVANAKNLTRELSSRGGKRSVHVRVHLGRALYQKDCEWCNKLLTSVLHPETIVM